MENEENETTEDKPEIGEVKEPVEGGKDSRPSEPRLFDQDNPVPDSPPEEEKDETSNS
jgi:hypothetical protein